MNKDSRDEHSAVTSSTNGSSVEDSQGENSVAKSPRLWARIREATGTVYGDIGTSVLYTIMEITRETVLLKHSGLGHDQASALIASGGQLLSRAEILGGLSLVYWALIFLTLKYDLLIMRADHRGEGGTFALWSLLKGYTGKVLGGTAISFLVITAAALLTADGVITPPISMLGAFEPLGPSASVIATLVCLTLLFKMQWRGTSKVGGIFGWFMILVWFPWIAAKSMPWILANPDIFSAVNPMYAISFLASFPSIGALVVIGVVVLAITGGEAKYADIGHFSTSSDSNVEEGESLPPKLSGRMPVMYSWFMIVLPCLLISYSGQSAYLLSEGVPPRANTFYAITPKVGNPTIDSFIGGLDMFIAAIAAIIASQALITGMFSIVKQATALGFLPRFRVIHTDEHGEGQVYIPAVNWLLFVGCCCVTIAFQTSGNLAAAYGIAVTGTMGITTIIFGYVAFYRWKWKLITTLLVCLPILVIDLGFLSSNTLKLLHGGYVPVVIAMVLVSIMLIWQWGRKQLGEAFYNFGVKEGKRIEWLATLREMLDDIEIAIQENLPAARQLIQGNRRLVESDRAAVFLCSRPITSTEDYVPVVLRVFLKKYGVLPSQVVFLHVNQLNVASISPRKRCRVMSLGSDIHSVVANYGYMEQPNVRALLKDLRKRGRLPVASERWIIEVGEEEVIVDPQLNVFKRMVIYAFSWILRLSTPAHKYLGLSYDAAISKEVIPVWIGTNGAKITLPELELTGQTR